MYVPICIYVCMSVCSGFLSPNSAFLNATHQFVLVLCSSSREDVVSLLAAVSPPREAVSPPRERSVQLLNAMLDILDFLAVDTGSQVNLEVVVV